MFENNKECNWIHGQPKRRAAWDVKFPTTISAQESTLALPSEVQENLEATGFTATHPQGLSSWQYKEGPLVS